MNLVNQQELFPKSELKIGKDTKDRLLGSRFFIFPTEGQWNRNGTKQYSFFDFYNDSLLPL